MIRVINLFIIIASIANQASPSEKVLKIMLNHYTKDFNNNDVKVKYKQIPVDLRSLIRDNIVAKGRSNLVHAFSRDFEKSFQKKLDDIRILVSDLTNENTLTIQLSLEASSVFIFSLDHPRYACIPDSAKPHIKECRDYIFVRAKDIDDANKIESNTSDALHKAYSSSNRDMNSDFELFISTIRFKIEFEDFMKDTNILDLLASCRSINDVFSTKRFIGEFDSKTMKIPNFVLIDND